MERSDDLLVARLKDTSRCRPEIKRLAEEWAGIPAPRYDALAEKLCGQKEGQALGILLNVAAANRIKLRPGVLAAALPTVDDITDMAFPCRFQDQAAIAPLLEAALAEDISWERQAMAALLAAELTVKFDQPRQPARKVLWQLSREIFAPQAQALVHAGLGILDEAEFSRERRNWLSERDIFRELPKERPAAVIGGDYTVRRPIPKLGRNDPCHCGSGKKYKKCCYEKDQELLRDASGYEGLTRTQLRETPSLVEDTTPIERMRLKDLKDLVPAALNEDQLFTAYRRASDADLQELAFAMLLELKQRPGKEDFAIDHLRDLFDLALHKGNRELAEKIAQHIPAEKLYLSETSRFQHTFLQNPEVYADLEALCETAVKGPEKPWEHPLLELSYVFETTFPALSLVFGRAAIVSEPQRTLDNETLFGTLEKSRIALDLEPWGDPIEEYLDWLSEKEAPTGDKDKQIEDLEKKLAAAREKSDRARNDLRRKERELAALETRRNSAAKVIPAAPAAAPAPAPPPPAGESEENRRQIQALRSKIETLKDEIRSQQSARQDLRGQLLEANQKLSAQEKHAESPATSPTSVEEGIAAENLPKQIRIPEYSAAFRKSCEKPPSPVVAKALQAAAGFAALDESVLRQAAPLELLPGYFRIRIGIHYRLLVRQAEENVLEVADLIHRHDLETWIRQHSG